MNQRKRDYAQALDLEFLAFEELGRSPVSRSGTDRVDFPADKPPIPHFQNLKRRVGDPEDRELFSGQFGPDLA